MSQRRTRYRLEVEFEAIEKARKAKDLSQRDFAQLGDFGLTQYQEKLRIARRGETPNVSSEMIAGICTALDWPLDAVARLVVDKQ